MPAKKQDRSNGYYERRLKDEHRSIYDDFVAGKHESLASALRAAGLKKGRTALHELKNAWSKASAKERKDFVDWLKLKGPPSAIPAPPSRSARKAAFTADRRLLPWATKRLTRLMTQRAMKMGDLLGEMGINKLNASIGLALRQGYRIKDANVADKLEQWLADNRGK